MEIVACPHEYKNMHFNFSAFRQFFSIFFNKLFNVLAVNHTTK